RLRPSGPGRAGSRVQAGRREDADGPSSAAATVASAASVASVPLATKLASGSWFPCPLGDGRYECFETRRWEIDRAPLLGAHVGSHQHLHHVEPIVPRQRWLLLIEEAVHEVAVLGLIAVGRGFAGDHRHLPDFGVLLLHQIL